MLCALRTPQVFSAYAEKTEQDLETLRFITPSGHVPSGGGEFVAIHLHTKAVPCFTTQRRTLPAAVGTRITINRSDYESSTPASQELQDNDVLKVVRRLVEFPVDQFEKLVEGLQRVSWMVYPGALSECLEAETKLVGTDDTFADYCKEERRQLVRRWAPEAFELCLESTSAVPTWTESTHNQVRSSSGRIIIRSSLWLRALASSSAATQLLAMRRRSGTPASSSPAS